MPIEAGKLEVPLVPRLKAGWARTIARSADRESGRAGERIGDRVAAGVKSRARKIGQGIASAVRKGGELAVKAAKGLAIGTAGVAVAALGFATKSASTFSNLGREVVRLERFTGLTADAASKLRGASKLAGVDVMTLSRGIGLLSKKVVAGSKDLKGIGIAFKDAHGKILPTDKLIGNIADRFAKLPAGPQRTALAMKLFGRSGAELLPLLARGSKGIGELEAKAKQLGITLTDKDVDAFKKSAQNSRLFHAGLEGLQVQIGRYVLPILTALTGWLANRLPGAIRFASNAMGLIHAVAVRIGRAFKDLAHGNVNAFALRIAQVFGPDTYTKAQAVGRALLKVGEAFKRAGLAVAGFVKRNPKLILAALAIVIGAVLVGAVWALVAAVAALFSPVTLIAAGIGLLVLGVIYAYHHFAVFRAVVDATARFLHDRVWPAIQAVASVIVTQLGNAIAWVRKIWPQISDAIASVMDDIRQNVALVLRTVSALWDRFGVYVLGIVRAAWNLIRGQIAAAMGIIRGVITLVLAIINGDWSRAWHSILGILSGIWGLIVSVIRFQIALVKNLLAAAWSAVEGVVHRAWNRIVGDVSGAIGRVVGAVAGLAGRLLGVIGRVASAAGAVGSAIWHGITDGISGAVHAVGDIAGKIWGAVKGFVNDHLIGPIRHFGVSVLGHHFNPFGSLPYLARGGITDGPSIAGEAGREVVIPLTGSRDRQLELLERSGLLARMIGAARTPQAGTGERGRTGAILEFSGPVQIGDRADLQRLWHEAEFALASGRAG